MVHIIRRILLKTAWIRSSLLKVLSVLILASALVLFLTDLFVINENRSRVITTTDGWGTWNWSIIKVDNYETLYETWIQAHAMTPIFNINEKLRIHNDSDEMSNRLRNLERVCNYYKLNEKSTFWKIESNKDESLGDGCSSDRCSILVDETTDLFFCFIPKVASTNFKHYFMTLIDINISSNYLGFHSDANFFLSRVSPSYYTRTDLLKYFYKKIVFVRHPFRRLVSIYLDKLVKPRGRTIIIDGKELPDLYYTYSVPIMKRYRGDDFNEKLKPKLAFNEFVDYLLETPPIYYNAHWIPYWIRCEPCLIKYDFIGKVETMENDVKFAFDLEFESLNHKSLTNESIALKLFGHLPLTTRLQLYHIYRIDFEMFGYTADSYLNI